MWSETQPFEPLHRPLRSPPNVGGVVGVGAHTRDAQKLGEFVDGALPPASILVRTLCGIMRSSFLGSPFVDPTGLFTPLSQRGHGDLCVTRRIALFPLFEGDAAGLEAFGMKPVSFSTGYPKNR